MERLPVHKEIVSNAPGELQYDAPAAFLNVQKPGYGISGKFSLTGQKLELAEKHDGSVFLGTNDSSVWQLNGNYKRLCDFRHFCTVKYDPYGYYFINFIKIQSQNLLFFKKVRKQAVSPKLINYMNRYHSDFSSNVCNLPVVFRGGGYAGRAGKIAHRLRFP